VLEKCKELRRLDVSHCPFVTNETVRKLIDFLNDILSTASSSSGALNCDLPSTSSQPGPSTCARTDPVAKPVSRRPLQKFVLQMYESGIRGSPQELAATHPLLKIRQIDDQFHIYLSHLFPMPHIPFHRNLGRVLMRNFDIMPRPFMIVD
jgi:hypothetical protein